MDNPLLKNNSSGQFMLREMSPAFPEEFPLSGFIFTGAKLIGCETTFASNELSNPERASIVILALISIVTSISVALTIFYNPKLRIHPSKLIGYMCVCEAASCFSALIWVINPLNYICYFGIHYLWHWTTG